MVFIDQNLPKAREFSEALSYPLGERCLGHGLLTELDNNKWRARRSLLNVGFHRQSLMSFMSEFNSKGDSLVNHLRLMADGKTQIKLLTEFNHAALDVIASVS
jgi:cytochrome P450